MLLCKSKIINEGSDFQNLCNGASSCKEEVIENLTPFLVLYVCLWGNYLFFILKIVICKLYFILSAFFSKSRGTVGTNSLYSSIKNNVKRIA